MCVPTMVLKLQKPNVLSSTSSLVDRRLICEGSFEWRARISCPRDLVETVVTYLVVLSERSTGWITSARGWSLWISIVEDILSGYIYINRSERIDEDAYVCVSNVYDLFKKYTIQSMNKHTTMLVDSVDYEKMKGYASGKIGRMASI